MLNHDERLATARSAIDYITGQAVEHPERPVPNCPGWTVYNAAAHIGRVAIAWREMINASPDDPDSRARGYERSGKQPAGAPVADLAAWAHAAVDELTGDIDRRCYFSMTGGEGTAGLWAWHAASELGLHRLDVEAALEHPHALTDTQALDAAVYTGQFFLPAMRRITEEDPGRLTARLASAGGVVGTVEIDSDGEGAVVEGPPIQVLLALWGRPYRDVELVDDNQDAWERWRALPGRAFQFGTWD